MSRNSSSHRGAPLPSKQNGKRRARRIPRPIASPVPESMTVSLLFNKSNNLGNSGNANALWSMLVTDPVFIDKPQTNTNQNLPFYDMFATGYRKFRVESAHVKAEFANLELFPVTVMISAVNQAVSQNDSRFDTFYDQKWTLRKLIGPLTGNGITTLSRSWQTSTFGGAPERNALDFYVGDTDPASTVRPTNNWYIVAGARSNQTLTSASVDLTISVTMKIRFFELDTPDT